MRLERNWGEGRNGQVLDMLNLGEVVKETVSSRGLDLKGEFGAGDYQCKLMVFRAMKPDELI